MPGVSCTRQRATVLTREAVARGRLAWSTRSPTIFQSGSGGAMGTRLYVGNLSYNSTKESLRAAFAVNGREVTDAHIVTDRESGQSRGFGFVTLATEEQAQAAMTEMNGAMLDGRALRVNEAGDRPQRGGGGGGPGPGRDRR